MRRVIEPYPGAEDYGGRISQYGYYADVSPDGSRIVYSTCEYTVFDHDRIHTTHNLGYELAAVNVDGSGRQRLTNNVHFDNYPVWSPDGARIAFIAHNDYSRRAYYDYYLVPDHYDPHNSDIFTRAADGTDERVVPNTKGVGLYPPVWSPDGERLAFTAHERVGTTIRARYAVSDPLERILYTVRLDGSDRRRIGRATTLPTWSPDGERLAFGLEDGVYTVRFDGTALQELLDDFRANDVSWSPDGTQLLLASNEGVYVVRPDGSGLRRLGPRTRTTAAAWSPDGSMIAARRELDLDLVSITRWRAEIFIMARDGSDVRVLAEAFYEDSGYDEKLKVRATNPPPPMPLTPAVCSEGVVVPEPAANPGLVEDCEALVAALGRDEWSAHLPVWAWEGVEVRGDPPRVRGLSLSGAGLTGTIRPELGDLKMLEVLDLVGNGLVGRIPSALGKLTMLKRLYLNSNALSGGMSPSLGRLTMLKTLDLSRNNLSGPIPPELGKLVVLERLELHNNALSGRISSELGKLTMLKTLSLSINNLSGPIPSELGKLTMLKTLSLSINNLSGPIPSELGKLTMLETLALGRNNLGGPIPPELGKLTRLEGLYLGSNNLSGPIPPELGRLTKLKVFSIYDNDLIRCVPAQMPYRALLTSRLPRCNSEGEAGS